MYLSTLSFRQKAVFLRLLLLALVTHKNIENLLELMINVNGFTFCAFGIQSVVEKQG